MAPLTHAHAHAHSRTRTHTGERRDRLAPASTPVCRRCWVGTPEGRPPPAAPLPLATEGGGGAALPSRGATNHRLRLGGLSHRFPAVGVGGGGGAPQGLRVGERPLPPADPQASHRGMEPAEAPAPRAPRTPAS